MIDLVVDNGGYIHDGLVVVESEGQFSVHADVEEGDLLIEVPDPLLVPVDRPEEMSAVQRDLFEAHLAVYDAAGKMEWAHSHLPAVVLADRPDALAVVQRLRPSFGQTRKSVRDAFVATRVLGGKGGRVLMPVVDLVNHHPSGSPFRRSGRSLRLTAARATGGTECFACYSGRLDVIDQVLSYGFVLDEFHVTGAVPVQVEVDGLQVSVRGRPASSRDVLDPPEVGFDGSTLVLSHLTFDAEHPRRTETVLALAVRLAMKRIHGSDPGESDLTRRLLAEIVRADAAVGASVRRDLQCDEAVRALIVQALDIHDQIVERTMAAGPSTRWSGVPTT